MAPISTSAAPGMLHFQTPGKEMRCLLHFWQCLQTEEGSLMGANSCEAPGGIEKPGL